MMIRERLIVALLAAALGVPLAGATQAGTLDVASVTGNWTGLGTLPTTTGITGLNTGTVGWGTPGRKSTKSSYSFVGKSASGIVSGQEFDLGTFNHDNREIRAGTSITGASLKVAINLVISGVQKTFDAAFDFAHLETSNRTRGGALCANGGANKKGVNKNGCADKVTISGSKDSTNGYEIDGFLYTLDITGFTIGSQKFSEFWTKEKALNSAVLQGRFTIVELPKPPRFDPPLPDDPLPPTQQVAAVPLPGTAAILFSALCGLALMRRRRA